MKKVVKNESAEWAGLRKSLVNFIETIKKQKKSKSFKYLEKSNHIDSVQGDTVPSCEKREPLIKRRK